MWIHKSQTAQASLNDCGSSQLNHPSYSHGLAPSDYYLFRNLKKKCHGHRFSSDEELKVAGNTWIEDQDKYFF